MGGRMELKMLACKVVCCLLVLHYRMDVVQAVFKNVALGKPTTQKNTHDTTRYASKAVDGILEHTADYVTCTSTKGGEHKSWWVVDLLHHYDIQTIKIQNRIYYSGRLRDFYVYVSTTNPVPLLSDNYKLTGDLCLHQSGAMPGGVLKELKCYDDLTSEYKSIKGRYVYVWKPAFDSLHICEFEVWVDVDISQNIYAKKTYPGHKSLVTPVYSEALRHVSSTTCCLACTSTNGTKATRIQLNVGTGWCECIRLSDFIDEDVGMSVDEAWDVWDMDVFVN